MSKLPTIDEDLVTEYMAIRQKLLNFAKRNADIIERFRSLERSMEKAEEALKVNARCFSEPGKTSIVYDTAAVTISVTGALAAPTYDLERAKAKWPSSIVQQCLVLNDERARELCKIGAIDGATLALAENPREEKTPAVKIRCT